MKGFSLLEVAIALSVAAFCLLAVIGLIPAGIASSRASSEQTRAIAIANAVEEDLRATPLRNPAAYPAVGTLYSPRFGIAVPALSTSPTNLFLSEDGNPTGVPSARYRVTVTGPTQPSGAVRGGSVASVRVSWPATAETNMAGSVETLIILDRN